MTAVLARLAELQQQFGEVVRTPLARSSGTLLAHPERYDPTLCARLVGGPGVCDRLAIYNRQYWFRLFGVLYSEYRLVAALLGERTFSALASQFFISHPPRGVQLATAGDGLLAFLERSVFEGGIEVAETRQRLPRSALIEAVQIDVAFQRIFSNGPQPPLRLTAEAAAELATARLVPSPSAVLVDECWPLVALRRRLVRDPQARADLPRPHAAPRTFVLSAKARGVRVLPLVPLNARLLRELAMRPVGAAIAAVAAACGPADAALLARHAESWLVRSVELGMWTGIERSAP